MRKTGLSLVGLELCIRDRLTSDSLVIRLCLDSLHRSIGGGHPVVYTAEKKRFISKMKKKVREQLKINP